MDNSLKQAIEKETALSKPDQGTEDQRKKVINLLQSWIEAEDDDQKETGDYLVQALDDDHLSARPLFSADLEGITW
jgi:hypothetical protein